VRRLGGELVLLTNVSYNTINYTQTMTEWMSGAAITAGAVRESPFLLKCVALAHIHLLYLIPLLSTEWPGCAARDVSRYFRLCHDFAELEQVRGPKIVLTSTESLAPSYGKLYCMKREGVRRRTADSDFLSTNVGRADAAMDLFVQWAADARNTIIFTSRPQPGSLAHQILSGPRQSQLVVKVRHRGDQSPTY